MENMIWIENNFESTLVPQFFINSRIDMASFVNLHKMVARRSAFLVIPSAQSGGEKEGQAESGRLKHQFSQMEGDLDL
jgi:hypothetical protein